MKVSKLSLHLEVEATEVHDVEVEEGSSSFLVKTIMKVMELMERTKLMKLLLNNKAQSMIKTKR